MGQDNYGLTVSCSDDKAVAAYRAGIDCALSLDRSGIQELKAAVELDPEFALAHAALARQLLIHGFPEQIAEHVHAALEHASNATTRELSAIEVITAATHFDSSAATLAQTHADKFPSDVFVLSHLIGPFGLLAFSGEPNWREQNVALLERTQGAYAADDWWHVTARAFMCAEVGQLKDARLLGERAWALKENGSCAHTLVHVHFEDKAIDEGQAFIESWREKYGSQSDMRHHLTWHSAMLAVETGEVKDLLDLYDTELDASICDPMPLTTLSDNASLLWRCALNNIEVSTERSREVLQYALEKYPHVGFPFADIHRGMMAALTGEVTQKEFWTKLRAKGGAKYFEDFVAALFAYSAGDYELAVKVLTPVLDDAILLGGSNPQRRIIEETYKQALKKSE